MKAKTTAFLTLFSYQFVTAILMSAVVPMGVVTISSVLSLFRVSVVNTGSITVFPIVVLISQVAFALGTFFPKIRFQRSLHVLGFAGMIIGYVMLAQMTEKGDYGDRTAQMISFLTGIPFVVFGFKSLGKVTEERVEEARRLGKDIRNPEAQLLDEILSIGMTRKQAVSAVSEIFTVSRLPRYYSEQPDRERIEVDTDKATFVINTKNGEVISWNAK